MPLLQGIFPDPRMGTRVSCTFRHCGRTPTLLSHPGSPGPLCSPIQPPGTGPGFASVSVHPDLFGTPVSRVWVCMWSEVHGPSRSLTRQGGRDAPQACSPSVLSSGALGSRLSWSSPG